MTSDDSEPHGRDWWWLDDAASLLVIGALALAIVVFAVAIASGAVDANISADIGIKGTIDLGLVGYALLGVAILDIWGRRRLQGAISILRGGNK